MIKIGVIGLGMMGMTHLGVYSRLKNAHVVAVSDKNPDLLSGKAQAQGNIEGQFTGDVNLKTLKKYDDASKLIGDKDIELVDLCIPTYLHVENAIAALEAEKHVLIEKPLANTSEDCLKIAEAADKSSSFAMPGMCMRFWPGWVWLKETIDQERYGRVLAANFRRLVGHPGGPIYSNGDLCGGAILDFHIHDTDFIQYCFVKVGVKV